VLRRLGIAIGLLTLGAAACGDDDAPATAPDAGAGTGAQSGSAGRGGSAGGGSGGSSGSSGQGGASTGGSAGNAGTVGNAGSSGSAGSGGTSGTGGSSGTGGTGGTSSVECPVFPAPSGATQRITPAQAGELPNLVGAAASGTTLLLEDGTYTITAPLWFRTSGVSLRSASNDASKVTIDGNYAVNETIAIQASNVTIAHVTLTRSIDHLVHVSPPDGNAGVSGTVLYGLRLIDGGEQFVKVNPNGARSAYVDQGRVECSSFELTDAGRPHIEPCCGGCYTGGIDVHGGRDWVVRTNRFASIYCPSGLAEHAIHFWTGSRGTLVENNSIINCARGIGFGLGEDVSGARVYPDANNGQPLGHYDGIIRNNVIWANVPAYDTGIELQVTKRPIVVHNTVIHGAGATNVFRSIDYRFAGTDVVIANNLTISISSRDGAQGMLANNLEATPLDYFVDAAGLDFHLKASATNAIDRGQVRAEAGIDMDGQPHDQGAPDLGADEYRP
jgi:hypothetical protein